MPELPDLEVFSRNLNKQLSGKQVKAIEILNPKKLNVSVKEFRKALEKDKISKIYREGKELYIVFDKGNVVSLHLMLNGELHLYEDQEAPKSTLLVFTFDDDRNLALSDFRGLARFTLNPVADDTPDALSKAVDQHFFQQVFSGKKAAVKNILLDQHIVRGIGNAYADEILWEARISPFSSAELIPEKKLKDLSEAVQEVLSAAIKKISADHPDLISGEIRDFLKIHHPKKTHSPTGETIQIKKAGARKTYYTDEQQLYQ